MKKIIIITSSIIFLLCAVLTIYPNFNSDKKILKNSINQNNKIVNSNSLTMMYETEAGSGEYQVASDSTWPESGYVFNANLSKCENGSKLTWNEESKTVLMSANTSDKCYVYFDVEELYLIISTDLGGASSLGFIYLNEVQINTELNTPIPYKKGDELTYGHLQACPERGLKIYNKDNELIKQISSEWGYFYDTITLDGSEVYVVEYAIGVCEPS